MADETKSTPTPKDRKVKPGQVTVRVVGKQAINEGGQFYQPERKAGGKAFPADTFETTPDRADALGEHVEVVTT
jgi:hypothetical protein